GAKTRRAEVKAGTLIRRQSQPSRRFPAEPRSKEGRRAFMPLRGITGLEDRTRGASRADRPAPSEGGRPRGPRLDHQLFWRPAVFNLQISRRAAREAGMCDFTETERQYLT